MNKYYKKMVEFNKGFNVGHAYASSIGMITEVLEEEGTSAEEKVAECEEILAALNKYVAERTSKSKKASDLQRH